MKHRSNSIHSDNHSICRIRPTMRTNITLRSNSHHQPPLSNSIHRHKPGRMNLRGLFTLATVHLLFLHETGSNNPTGIPSDADKIPFHPYYTIKDIRGVLLLVLFLILLVLFTPDLLADPDNYTPANPLNTPPHIKPKWYFLFAYAILRSIPNKLGVLALIFSILVLILIPLLHISKQ
ncbi:hypothetical protein Celaphus_00007569 [Cervus elaphus hippelaphus]|uniref:Cytochrome b n=1 Tax=Cervus elaphus hippelaphus TaxID=46360 RepID=A0A212CAV9_CEREH|nr:hypothetical protein Celaphus_00007569 [Cervus elaphus hippelaphus]